MLNIARGLRLLFVLQLTFTVALEARAQPQAGLRNPREAVTFIRRFSQELGLPPETLKKKAKLAVSSPAKLMQVFPALFYVDLKGPYAKRSHLLGRTAPVITIDGDPHIDNFGSIRGEDGAPMWGLNDLDMAARGSVEYDLERLGFSILLMGPSDHDGRARVAQMAHAYLAEMARLAKSEPSPYAGLRVDEEAEEPVRGFLQHQAGKPQKKMLDKMTAQGRFIHTRKLTEPSAEDRQLVSSALSDYERTHGPTPALQRPLKVLDITTIHEAGGSTFGLHRFYALLQGSAAGGVSEGLPVVVEVKQMPTAPETATGDLKKANAAHLLEGMQALGGTPNPIDTTATVDGYAYLIREREREGGSIDLDGLSPADWSALVAQAGRVLLVPTPIEAALRKAVTDWVGSDEATLVRRLQDFSEAYSEQQIRQDTKAYAASLGD